MPGPGSEGSDAGFIDVDDHDTTLRPMLGAKAPRPVSGPLIEAFKNRGRDQQAKKKKEATRKGKSEPEQACT